MRTVSNHAELHKLALSHGAEVVMPNGRRFNAKRQRIKPSSSDTVPDDVSIPDPNLNTSPGRVDAGAASGSGLASAGSADDAGVS